MEKHPKIIFEEQTFWMRQEIGFRILDVTEFCNHFNSIVENPAKITYSRSRKTEEK